MEEDKKLRKKVRQLIRKFIDDTTEKRGETGNRKWVCLKVVDDAGTIKVKMDSGEMENLINRVQAELSIVPYAGQAEEYRKIIAEKLLKEISKKAGAVKTQF